MNDDFYTYELMYPDGIVFYVGKGRGDRIDFHEKEARRGGVSYKCNVIRQIWNSGGNVLKRKVREHMTEKDAYNHEVELILLHGREHLTNLTDGGKGTDTVFANPLPFEIKVLSGDLVEAIDKKRGNKSRRAYLEELLRSHPDLKK